MARKISGEEQGQWIEPVDGAIAAGAEANVAKEQQPYQQGSSDGYGEGLLFGSAEEPDAGGRGAVSWWCWFLAPSDLLQWRWSFKNSHQQEPLEEVNEAEEAVDEDNDEQDATGVATSLTGSSAGYLALARVPFIACGAEGGHRPPLPVNRPAPYATALVRLGTILHCHRILLRRLRREVVIDERSQRLPVTHLYVPLFHCFTIVTWICSSRIWLFLPLHSAAQFRSKNSQSITVNYCRSDAKLLLIAYPVCPGLHISFTPKHVRISTIMPMYY
uniref:Uncharacterized protein n=1 Tax=Oryza meridionalis TaxID=40149 RepID=A0A0E0F4M5_9ORYZ